MADLCLRSVQYPLFSFMGDFRMLYEVYTGARAF